MTKKCCAFPLFLLFVLPATFSSGQDFQALLHKVPATANALALIDVEATLASPLAEEQGWGKKLELAYVNRPVYLPPEANRVVIAAALQPSETFARLWELAVMDLDEPLSMRTIARSEGGYVDEVQGLQSAWTPSDAYFVSFNDRQLGVMFPAERQFVSRWAADVSKNRTVNLSSYLEEAAALASQRIQVVMAVDLTDVVQPHQLVQKIEDSESLKKLKLPPEQLVPLLASVRGVTLRLGLTDRAHAQLKVDFAIDLAPIESVAKELVLEVLDDLGFATEAMKSWKAEVKGSTVALQGVIGEEGLRRIFRVIEIPSTKFSSLKEAGETADQEGLQESKQRESSLVYFRSVEVLLKDLKRDLSGNKAKAAVMERYARNIDRMPILNVDPELLDFGAKLATTLRSVALTKRQGGIDYGVNTAGMGGGGYDNYGWYGVGYFGGGGGGDLYEGARASAADRTAARQEAMAAYNDARVTGAKNIADALADIRRKMTQKYQVEF